MASGVERTAASGHLRGDLPSPPGGRNPASAQLRAGEFDRRSARRADQLHGRDDPAGVAGDRHRAGKALLSAREAGRSTSLAAWIGLIVVVTSLSAVTLIGAAG